MAITNRDRIDKGLELLREGLRPYIERELKSFFRDSYLNDACRYMRDDLNLVNKPLIEWDSAALLKLMWEAWNDVFRKTLGNVERSLVSELRTARNNWAHQKQFSGDDTYRALDSIHRLLTSVSAPQSAEIEKMKAELLRLRFDEQVRGELRRGAAAAIESSVTGQLKPWREVVVPHKDVASGRYQQAEFAADLWQVHLGEGSDEYLNPVEFFRRTYLTESLRTMLVGAVQRLSGTGGDPVIQLQTNFGGGKTHSMLALYHLFSDVDPSTLVGIDSLLAEAKVTTVPAARRVVLVGNKISPGNPSVKPDGTVVRTLWGELAWQLGGKKAYEKICLDDEKATSPGDALRELFVEYGPCLILIDEWVAYARQLHEQSDLPAGGFETQFSFAQALTESAKLAKNCLLIVSLPASDTTGSPHTQTDDVEVGGQRGREALDRLRNVIGRVESSWRPASAEEGFEIVRRRLFEPLIDNAKFKDRDVVARAFADFYRTEVGEFPPECREGDYEKRLKAAYPIHPEVFDRLYTDWSTLVKFQRTRGVLRLMAAVIHSLWEKGDRNPLILPANIAIDDPRVQSELTRYLSDNWVPVIEKDVDGPDSLPSKLDGAANNLGRYQACRRVARAIYLGSAPLATASHRGIEDRRIKLGCLMPGEPPSIFGDALRRLAGSATYLYHDGSKYWYSTQPTVTKLAEDRAEQIRRDRDKITDEIEKWVQEDLRVRGELTRIHDFPHSGQDVPDDFESRLIVLRAEYPYSKEAGNAAEAVARTILETRGNSPRIYRNTLVFLAADKLRLQDLEDATRRYLAWESILADRVGLNLDHQQGKQAEDQRDAARSAVTSRIRETFCWLIVPSQANPQSAIEWQAHKLSGQEPLAVRVGKKLRTEESLLLRYSPSNLRIELDRVPLWRGDSVSVKQLVDDFARYLYLPRLRDPSVLVETIQEGLSLTSWKNDSFAFAESYDESRKRYRGLRGGQAVMTITAESSELLVKPDVAALQLDVENDSSKNVGTIVSGIGAAHGSSVATGVGASIVAGTGQFNLTGGDATMTLSRSRQLKRYYGTVSLDPMRVGRDASRIAEEVVQHLAGIVGSEVEVTLEIQAKLPQAASEKLVRDVSENSSALKFKSYGFEEE